MTKYMTNYVRDWGLNLTKPRNQRHGRLDGMAIRPLSKK